VIDRGMRPRLAPRARLRLDRRTGGHLLLYPEKGLELSPTAADVLLLCTGEHSVGMIVRTLADKYAAPTAEVERDVIELLEQMLDRAIVTLTVAGGPGEADR
jgi:coenzyme PQQ biosynthesis protein PqqD